MLLIRCKSLCQRNAQRSTESSKSEAIVVGRLSGTGVPGGDLLAVASDLRIKRAGAGVEPHMVSVAGSNVPFVLVAGNWIARFTDAALVWKVLALATTFAGNLTIVGSVANMIVVESARNHIQVSFWDYSRFGIPVTILTTAAGAVVLLVLR
jgi:Na+/H+ antiporter NhaD/arsenite permease-like protein